MMWYEMDMESSKNKSTSSFCVCDVDENGDSVCVLVYEVCVSRKRMRNG